MGPNKCSNCDFYILIMVSCGLSYLVFNLLVLAYLKNKKVLIKRGRVKSVQQTIGAKGQIISVLFLSILAITIALCIPWIILFICDQVTKSNISWRFIRWFHFKLMAIIILFSIPLNILLCLHINKNSEHNTQHYALNTVSNTFIITITTIILCYLWVQN